MVKPVDPDFKKRYQHPEYDALQYLLIDGKFRGAVLGHFKNGPYVIEDIVLDLSDAEKQRRKQEITEAVYTVNDSERSPIQRYCGVPL